MFLFTIVCRYEHFFGPLATHNLCVTNAMKVDLQNNWGIRWCYHTYHFFVKFHQTFLPRHVSNNWKAEINDSYYWLTFAGRQLCTTDQPRPSERPRWRCSTSSSWSWPTHILSSRAACEKLSRHLVCLFKKMSFFRFYIWQWSTCSVWLICFASSRSEREEKNLEKTVFTVRDITDNTVTWRAKCPALLISSTSWTGETRRIKLVPLHLCQSLWDGTFQKCSERFSLKNTLLCHVFGKHLLILFINVNGDSSF